jgi:hypothetical protein
MSHPLLQKIVSGGQTGVDRAALDVAISLNIDHGGWCPAGRRSEAGLIPAIYRLQPTTSRNYAVRTEQNVIDSDGTLILYFARMSSGTFLTRKMAEKYQRPLRVIDLNRTVENTSEQLREWLKENDIKVLNVAGPRESTNPGIAQLAQAFLRELLQ